MIIKRKKGGKKWDLKSEKWVSLPLSLPLSTVLFALLQGDRIIICHLVTTNTTNMFPVIYLLLKYYRSGVWL